MCHLEAPRPAPGLQTSSTIADFLQNQRMRCKVMKAWTRITNTTRYDKRMKTALWLHVTGRIRYASHYQILLS